MYFKIGKKLVIGLLVLLMIISMSGLCIAMAEDAFSVALNPERDYLIVVNGWHPYEFGGEYDQLLQDDLIYVVDSYGNPTLVEKAAYLAFSMLKTELWNEHGITISLYSAYRDYDEQARAYDDAEEGEAEVAESLFSEHHTGLLIDFRIWQHGVEWYRETLADQLDDCFYEAIRGKLSKYGFIERYPLGKDDITGVLCQPSEIRFVGSVEVAQEIMNNGWCLEEYRMIHG